MSKKSKSGSKCSEKQACRGCCGKNEGEASPITPKKPKLAFKNGDWVVVAWEDAPDELAYVVDRTPEKGAKYADLCFLRGKKSTIIGVNHTQIMAVVPRRSIPGFALEVPDPSLWRGPAE